jgi:hypothetical protein
MTTQLTARKVLTDGLLAQGYHLAVDGPSGEYYHHDDFPGASLWVGWEFEGKIGVSYVEKGAK